MSSLNLLGTIAFAATFVGETTSLTSRTWFVLRRKFSTTIRDSKSQKLWLERQHRDPFVKAAGRLNYRARSAFKLLEIDDKFSVFSPGQVVLDCGAAPGSWSQVAVQRLRGPPKFKAYTVRQLLNNHTKPAGFSEYEIADFRSSPESGFVIGFDLSSISPLPGAAFISNADIFQPSTRDRIAGLLRQHRNLLDQFQRGDDDDDDDVSSSFDEGVVAFEDLSSSTDSDPNSSSTLPRCVDVVMSDMAPNASGLSYHDHDNICRLARGAYDLAAVFLKAEGTFLFKLWDGQSTARVVDQLKARFASVRIFKPQGSRSDSAEIFVVARGFKIAMD